MKRNSPRSLRGAARALSLALLAAGCSATSDPATGDLRLDLRHRDPRVRMEAAFLAAEGGRRDLAGELVENLADRDESVRFITGIALKRMTGQDFGYLSYGDLGERESAMERWRGWLRGASAPGEAPAPGTGRPAETGFSSADPGAGPPGGAGEDRR